MLDTASQSTQKLFMINFGQLLEEKTEAIAQKWVDAVIGDRQIHSSDNLDRIAIENHVKNVLTALATVLDQAQENDIESIAKASLVHGVLRAKQGFEPTEIAREYHLLRSTILDYLRGDLLQGSPEEVFRAMSIVNTVVDAAISQCFKSYVGERFQELEQLQNQLSLTNQELTRLVRASQDNLSLLAHELKSPLTSIIGYSELFMRQQRSAKVKDTVSSLEHIERVIRSGRQILRLINDALEFARYETGKMRLQLESIDVKTVIKTVVEVMQPLADSRGLLLVPDCNNAPNRVLTDPFRLQQILVNLVSNAIRYTKTGSISIECSLLADDSWIISISDTGVGIAPEDQSRIFDPFTRAILSDQQHPPDSTGLGLTIVSKLVELLQGEISLVSQIGVGTTFKVVFPLEVKLEEDA